MKPKIIAIAAAVVLLLVIILQNTGTVTLRLFFWKISMSMIIFLPLTLLIGFLFGVAVVTLFGKRGR